MEKLSPMSFGIAGNGTVYRNLPVARLVEKALERGEGVLAENGALAVARCLEKLFPFLHRNLTGRDRCIDTECKLRDLIVRESVSVLARRVNDQSLALCGNHLIEDRKCSC